MKVIAVLIIISCKLVENVSINCDKAMQARKVWDELPMSSGVKRFVRSHKTYVCLDEKGVTELPQKIEESLGLRD